MFNNNFKNIGKDIYVFKNYLSDKELSYYKKLIIKLNENNGWSDIFENTWYNQKLSVETPEIKLLFDKLSTTFNPKYYLRYNLRMNRLLKGEMWTVHSDDYDFIEIKKQSEILKPNQPYKEVPYSFWGLVVYFSEFDGGELFYPNQNIVYKPKPGDLVVHSSAQHCAHGVQHVASEVRYSYSNCLLKNIKVPI